MAASIDEAIVKMRKTLAVQKGLDAESEECKATASRWTRQQPAPKKKGPEPAAACAAALAKVCKGQGGKGATCNSCALTQWSALKAAGCLESEELTWCEAAPKAPEWSPPVGTCKCSGSPNGATFN